MKRPKIINDYIEHLEGLKAHLTTTAENKREKYDERSEKWQDSDKGCEEDSLIGSIEDAASEAETLIDTLTEIYPED